MGCILTEFLPKRGVLSLTLMYQGWIHNPNITTSGYQTKFWGSFGEIAHIAHIIQQNFVIGQVAKMEFIH